MKDLYLPMNFEYFDQIKAGEKTEEFRLFDKWSKRIGNKKFAKIILTRGYPKGGGIEGETRLTLPWRGWERRTITHKHFGPDPVDVFAIRLVKW